jgi:hypothetical protein
MMGLEDEQTVFARYQAIRRAERDYLPERTDVFGTHTRHLADIEARGPHLAG